MIRLASTRGMRSITIRSRIPSYLATRSFSKEADEKPKGIAYSKLTLGVPKERFPLEKRVAATPEVSVDNSTMLNAVLTRHIDTISVFCYYSDRFKACKTRLLRPNRERCRFALLFQ